MKKLPPSFPFILTGLQCVVAWGLLQASADAEVWYGWRMASGAIGLLTLIQANWTYTSALRNRQ